LSLQSGLLLLLALLLSACSAPRAWVYAPEPRQARDPIVKATLVVPPLLDRRTNDSTDAWLLYLIPLMPFGFQDLSVPESVSMHISSGQWQFRPADDFARALAQEIDAARIFNEAFTDPQASRGDFVLRGEIVEATSNAKLLSYCLSIYGPALWFIGLPATHTSNDLHIRLTLMRSGSSEIVWQHTIRGNDSQTGWIYAIGTDFMFDRILKREMPEALRSLENSVRNALTPPSDAPAVKPAAGN
jgi:hypothetical protein